MFQILMNKMQMKKKNLGLLIIANIDFISKTMFIAIGLFTLVTNGQLRHS